jgi:hypothetical protein
MSGLGHERHFNDVGDESALPPTPDIDRRGEEVRSGPQAEVVLAHKLTILVSPKYDFCDVLRTALPSHILHSCDYRGRVLATMRSHHVNNIVSCKSDQRTSKMLKKLVA